MCICCGLWGVSKKKPENRFSESQFMLDVCFGWSVPLLLLIYVQALSKVSIKFEADTYIFAITRGKETDRWTCLCRFKSWYCTRIYIFWYRFARFQALQTFWQNKHASQLSAVSTIAAGFSKRIKQIFS